MVTTPDSQPVVTVITVCFNAAKTLEACLRSVAEQTWPAIEYVVIDGASTDGTQAILQRSPARIDTLVSEPDQGIYDAMNKGIARATGAFLIFLNADDSFASPDAVHQAMAEIARHPQADVYYGSILILDGGRRMRHDPPPPPQAAAEMVLGCLPHQATFARRAVFDRTGPFDLRWRRHADYAWWMRVMADPGLRLHRIGTLVAVFRLGGASSDLLKGQPEVFEIQNAAALYQSPEWDRKRLAMFQRAWLEARVELARLRESAGSASGGMRLPGPRGLPARLRLLALRILPRPAVEALRSLKHRLLGSPRT
jgi:hypothetical protein